MTTKRSISAILAALLLALSGAGATACGGAEGGTGEELETPAGQGDDSGAAAGQEGGDE